MIMMTDQQALLSSSQISRKAVTALTRLYPDHPPSADEVEQSGNCRRCRVGKKGPDCQHCEATDLLYTYRTRLFSVFSILVSWSDIV